MPPTENHPDYPKWRKANDALADAIDAQKQGKATQAVVDRAQQKYDRVCNEIDFDVERSVPR